MFGAKYEFESDHFKPIFVRRQIMFLRAKNLVCKLQILKLPHFRKVCKCKKFCKSASLWICDLRKLFADHLPLINIRVQSPHLRKVGKCNKFCKSASLRICDLRKLFADQLPLINIRVQSYTELVLHTLNGIKLTFTVCPLCM